MVMASRDRSAKANRDLRWTTESCAQGEASGFGHYLTFEPRSEFSPSGSRERQLICNELEAVTPTMSNQ